MASLLSAAKSNVGKTAPKELAKAVGEGETKRLNVKLDPAKHERFRLACMTNHTTMTKAIEAFIDEYLEKHGR